MMTITTKAGNGTPVHVLNYQPGRLVASKY